MQDVPRLLEAHHVNQVILTDSSLGHDRIVSLILLCEKHIVHFNMVPDLFRILTSSMDVQSLDDIPLLGLGKWPLDFFWNRCMKRIEDVAGATIGLVLLSPLMLITAVAIKLTSPGSVFFRQERCGRDGRMFTIFKLRTMCADAEAATGPVFAVANDPRTTRLGRFLRQYNLDELPQLWNVFRGDMSLIGPRPERPHFVERFREDINRYMWRHVSRPGMTGWAQVNGLRGNTSIEERIKYDLYYLENWSLALDFKILVRTLFARENAY
jgi:exopolysaccharide biosynthesis polyprenyl glycosylphosphotransferase